MDAAVSSVTLHATHHHLDGEHVAGQILLIHETPGLKVA
jgi:hypothetical protein